MLTCNNVILIGNLGADPELRYTQSGIAVANFDIAVNRQSKDKDDVDWFRIVCWGKLAEAVANYCAKGQMVLVEGSLQSRSYEGKDGTKRRAVEVVASAVRFGQKPEQGGQAQDDFEDLGDDEDMPF